MQEIICPNCSKAFKIDESSYADILKQVRDSEFNEQLQERLRVAEREKKTAVELAETKVKGEAQVHQLSQEAEIKDLKSKLESEMLEEKLAVESAVRAVE